MSITGKFTKKVSEKKNDDDYDDFDGDVIVPDDDEIEEKLRVLDEVAKSFREEKLLGVNSYKKVQQSSKNAKNGVTKKSFGKSIF